MFADYVKEKREALRVGNRHYTLRQVAARRCPGRLQFLNQSRRRLIGHEMASQVVAQSAGRLRRIGQVAQDGPALFGPTVRICLAQHRPCTGLVNDCAEYEAVLACGFGQGGGPARRTSSACPSSRYGDGSRATKAATQPTSAWNATRSSSSSSGAIGSGAAAGSAIG